MNNYDKPDNLVEMAASSFTRNAHRPMFGTPDSEGNYTWATYQDVQNRVDALRAGLALLGVSLNDSVGIIANNRVEWAVAAFATFGLGGRFIPMYENELLRIWQHIIKDGGIKVLFVANEKIYQKIQSVRSELTCLEHLILIDGTNDVSMKDIETKGRKQPVSAICPKPDDIAVLIYTSGTTGNPKGVLLSHGNLTSNFIAGGARFPELNHESRSLSILPWAHSYGQTAELYNFIHLGASIGFVRNITTIAEDLANVAPSFLIAVPRVFNKIYDGLWRKIDETGGLAKKLFIMGLNSAAQIRALKANGNRSVITMLKYKLADAIVFKKIRERFGGKLKGALTASAMMNLEVAQFFTDIGLPVFDAYGLTETSPAVTMNNREANKPGSVGRPIDKVRVVIDRSFMDENSDEGEVIVYGPNVMQGYHNNPEATRRVITEDGGFRTGDIGRLDEDGFLFITGRIKEQYKLENGKYVFPASLEEEIQRAPYVESALVCGEGRPHNICLVVPDFDTLTLWANKHGIVTQPDTLIQNEKVHHLIFEAIQSHLKGKIASYEIPKSVVLIADSFSVDNGLLTQTLKLKRLSVMERYASDIESAYTGV